VTPGAAGTRPARPPLAALIALLAALVVALAGCGASGRPRLNVSAAASLRKAFTAYGKAFPRADARFSFAGSDLLAAQIEQGIRPDVFASADTQLPDRLFAEGLLERPVVFAANRLVLAVPAGSRIRSPAGIEHAGVSLAIGSPTVPIGAYTAKVIARLPAPARRAVLADVSDREPDVTGIIGKLTEGAIDAGFVYATDVSAAGGSLRAILLPEALQPRVAYGAAVVRGSAHAAEARAFLAGLLRGAGRRELAANGFLPPP
jgi:molybdate transport system substrate-binding protein